MYNFEIIASDEIQKKPSLEINLINSVLPDPILPVTATLVIIYLQAFDKFYLHGKNIFQKSPKNNNDVFFTPVDIGDNTIPNGNAIMLINLIRLGMIDEAKKLADSLNGYLNIYKNHMMTSLRAIDYFNNIKEGKNCNEQGCKIDVGSFG